MNDSSDASRAVRGRHRILVDVHDVGDGTGHVVLAAGARLIRQQLAIRQRQSEKSTLPVGRPDDAAQLLIGVVIGTQRIAMCQ
jgi:hypothetical protein